MRTLLRLLVAAVVTLALAEAGARVLTRTDDAGRLRFGDALLRPPLPTADALESWVREYRATEEERTIRYDSLLGWAPHSGAQTPDRRVAFDARGARRPVDGDTLPARADVVVAAIGDSYTFGAEVADRESWTRRLEARLDSAAPDVGVWNFGVGAYGMDQALLRWRHRVRALEPDVVLFGFQPENVKRNVNVFRPFYLPRTGVVFTKPRFVRDEGGLRLVNSPTVAPERLPGIVEDPGAWELARWEWFLDPAEAAPRWWRSFRLAAVVEAVANPVTPGAGRVGVDVERFYDLETEPARLALALLDELRRSVEAAGAHLVVVHLPRIGPDVQTVASGRRLWYRALWERIEACFRTVDPLDDLLAHGRSRGLRSLVGRAHYSPTGNRIVGRAVAHEVAGLLRETAPGDEGVSPSPACAPRSAPSPGRPGRSP